MNIRKIERADARPGDQVIEYYPMSPAIWASTIEKHGQPNLPPGPNGCRGYLLRIEEEDQ